MRVAHRIGAGFGLLVALMIAGLAYHTALVTRLIESQQQVSETTLRTARLASTLERQCDTVFDLTRKVVKIAQTGEPLPDEPLLPDYRAALAAERARLDATLMAFEGLPVSEAERQAIVQLNNLWAEHRATLRPWTAASDLETTLDASVSAEAPQDDASPTASALSNVPVETDADAPDALRPLPKHGTTLALLTRFGEQTRALRDATDQALETHLTTAREAGQQVGRTNSMLLLASLVMSVAVGYVTVRSITRPLGRLITATRAVASGRFYSHLDASRDDELGRVAAAFNTMTRRLEAFDRMKKDFVARVSHDLRTPLVAMQETNDVLLSRLVGPLNERQERLVALNRRGAKRLTTRIGHLLDLARLEAGMLELDARHHDVTRLLQDVLEGIEGRLSHRGIQLRTHLPGTAVMVYCDRERLIEVVENVLDNAIKFSPTGGNLDVVLETTEAPPGHLPHRWRSSLRAGSSAAFAQLAVIDEGPGLADADKARIFRSFFRANDEEQPKTTGVGLGLAICHDLVRAHHGAIWVTDNPGGGCQFHILLPLANPARLGSTNATTRAAPSIDQRAIQRAPCPPAPLGLETTESQTATSESSTP